MWIGGKIEIRPITYRCEWRHFLAPNQMGYTIIPSKKNHFNAPFAREFVCKRATLGKSGCDNHKDHLKQCHIKAHQTAKEDWKRIFFRENVHVISKVKCNNLKLSFNSAKHDKSRYNPTSIKKITTETDGRKKSNVVGGIS